MSAHRPLLWRAVGFMVLTATVWLALIALWLIGGGTMRWRW